jgi:hypothetical protein
VLKALAACGFSGQRKAASSSGVADFLCDGCHCSFVARGD